VTRRPAAAAGLSNGRRLGLVTAGARRHGDSDSQGGPAQCPRAVTVVTQSDSESPGRGRGGRRPGLVTVTFQVASHGVTELGGSLAPVKLSLPASPLSHHAAATRQCGPGLSLTEPGCSARAAAGGRA